MNTLFSFIESNQEDMVKIKKEAFLQSIRSKNENSINKYKRVVESPIRYAGGKSLAVGYIIELLPTTVKRIVSPFFGGGSVEIAISKHLGLEVKGFDIFDILVNYWKFQIEKPEVLYEELKKLSPDEKSFYEIREILKKHWEKTEMLDPLHLAVYYFYNFNLSYGPGFLGWPSKVYLNEKRYQAIIERVRDFKPGNLTVECADFRDVIKQYSDEFMYLDPPYYIGDDSKMFRGIYPQRNFPIHHRGFPHEELRDLIKNLKGGWILSYNDCPTIREWYKDYKMIFPTWQYTMGQGETRIGKYRKERGTLNNIKSSHEVIIYHLPDQQCC